jgi:membrane-bound lytic murein transglycosylase D
MKIISALLIAVPFFAAAQVKEVPHKMSFAGMTLTIRDDARREIQKDVDALTQSPKHFNIKADRARSYFPLIEQIFREEGVPEDFKFLVLQESSLVADAVSVSNAVGFWQFKDFTAIEMGLRVDKEIDERMNIASSTRAAARYIKKNNSFFDNWLYALQAYQMGAGGVMRAVDDPKSGEKHAEITSRTYWYVKKFLAYKVAYEDEVHGHGQVDLKLYETSAERTLADIAKEMNIAEEELRNYNKWVRDNRIPADRKYAVLIPFQTGVKLPDVQVVANKVTPKAEAARAVPLHNESRALSTSKINGVTAVLAESEEDAAAFALRTGLPLSKFLKYNDMSETGKVVAGKYYFTSKKRVRGEKDFHTLASGEDLWSVSQQYGVRLKRLKKYNRLKTSFAEVGTILYLSSVKPKGSKNPVVDNAVGLEPETINWSDSGEQPVVSRTSEPVIAEKSATPEIVVEAQPVLSPDSVKILQQTVETEISSDSSGYRFSVPVHSNSATHTVQPKETLYAIAKVYNVAVMDLVSWNNIDLQQGIKAGQVLKVSAEQPLSERKSVEVLHEVIASDTLYSISRKYGVTIKEIMDWNEKKDFSLSVGEKLKVKSVQ